MNDDYLRSPAGLVSLRTLTGRDLQPGESVQVTIGRYEDGRMYVAPPPLASSENMTVTVERIIDGEE